MTGSLSASSISGNGAGIASVTANDTTRFNTKLPSAYSLTSHTHAQLHDRLHDIDSSSDHSGLKGMTVNEI